MACRLDSKWSHDKLHVFCVYIDDVVRLWVEPWRVQIFTLEEGLKIKIFGHYQVKGAVCYGCVDFDIAHLAVCMIWKFVSHGSLTVNC